MHVQHLRQLLKKHWLLVGGAVLACSLLLLRQHFMIAVVVGDSMLPTVRPGQFLLVNRAAYKTAEPRRGDVVLARNGRDLIIKRIVGLPGEEVEVILGKLYINGVEQAENYRVNPGPLDVAKGTLFDGDFATLGDNRAIPAVVAIHPVISKQDIVGKVILKPRALDSARLEPSPRSLAEAELDPHPPAGTGPEAPAR